MYLRVRELLTTEQRKEFTSIPKDMSEWEIGLHYSFSNEDIEIINRHRRDYKRLGFAVQLCMVRFPGWPLTPDTEIPTQILQYIANQIDININEFPMYFKREATRHEHIEEIRQVYGYRNLSAKDYHWLLKSLIKHALENGNTNHLIKMAIDELRNRKIVLPAILTVERAVWESRKRAEEKIFKMINACLSEEQKKKLDTLIQSFDGSSKTKLSWLKDSNGRASPDTFMKIIEKLEYIRTFDLNINTTGIHHNRLIQLARLGARYEPHSFRRFEDKKRYAILVVFLIELSQDLIDQAIEIHDRQINTLFSKGKKEQEEIQKKNGKALNEKIVHFVDIGAALIKARNEGLDPFQVIENIMPWDDIVHSVEEAKTLARPIDYDYLDLLDKRYNQLRKYTPTLLKCLEFNSTESYKPVLEALNTINQMNETRKRNVPEDACLDFVSNRWNKHVFDSKGNINRHYYEMVALTELRNGIRSGDISVVGSRRHKDFNDYLISKEEWDTAKQEGTRLAVNLSVEKYLGECKESLHKRLSWIAKNIDSLEGINPQQGSIHVNRLEKNTPEEAKQFSLELYKMIPRIRPTDLLVEVSNWTKFDEQFTHASNKRKPKDNEKEIVMAALIAMGTNIGLAKMADATPRISYHQIANAAQWRMYDDALNKAQATLVNFHHKLALPSYWGDGTTSSSDGMRVQIGVASLHADANPHYGSGKGATIYI